MRTRHILLPLAALILVAGIARPGASAQTGNPDPVAQFLEITPVRQDFTVDKGQVATKEVTITNRHVSRIALKTSFDNLVASGDQGGTKYTNEPTPWDLKRYTSVNADEFTLQPRETRKVQVRIAMTNETAPGGYYGIVRFVPTTSGGEAPVAIQGQIASLFLVRVPGPTKEEGSIKDLYVTDPDGQRRGRFLFGNDMYLLTRIHNAGNVHFGTAPNFQLKDVFGKVRHNEQAQPENVFPQGERRFETRWQNAGTGIYTATVTSTVPGETVASKTIKVLVVTPVTAAVAGGILLLLALWLISRRNRRKRTKVTI